MAETEATSSSLVFAVNGERFELPTVDPSTTLLEFLRCQTRFKSVKLSCGEGPLSLALSLSMHMRVGLLGYSRNYSIRNLGFQSALCFL